MKISLTPNSFTSNKCNVKKCKSFKYGSKNVCDTHYFHIKFRFNNILTKQLNLIEFFIIKNINEIIKKKNLNIKPYQFVNLICKKQIIFRNKYNKKNNASNIIKNNIKKYITKKENSKIHECGICFDDITDDKKILQCSHVYHNKCINNWLVKSNSCPYCRTDITKIDKITKIFEEVISYEINWNYSYNKVINNFNNFWENTEFHKDNNSNYLINNTTNFKNGYIFSIDLKYTDKFIIRNIINRFNQESVFTEIPLIGDDYSYNLRIGTINILNKIKNFEVNNKSSYIIKELIIKNQLNKNIDCTDAVYEFSKNYNKIEKLIKKSFVNINIEENVVIKLNDLYVSIIFNIYYQYNELFKKYKKIIEKLNNIYIQNRYDTDFKYNYILFNKLKNKKLDDEIIINNSQYILINFTNNFKKNINLNTIDKLEKQINNYDSYNYNDEILNLIEKYYYLITSKDLKIDFSKKFKYDMKFKFNLENIIDKSFLKYKIPII
jgi:hypothetical protein